MISRIVDGDVIHIDAVTGELNVLDVHLQERKSEFLAPVQKGVGRELFSVFRKHVTAADVGAISIDWEE